MLTEIARILLRTYILLTFETKLHLLTWECKVISLFGIRPYVFAIHQELTKRFSEKVSNQTLIDALFLLLV